MVGKSGDKLKQRFGGNMAESMGQGVAPAPRPVATRELPPRQVGVNRTAKGTFVRLDRIVPDPGQPRKEFPAAEHQRLVESFRRHGHIQPIGLYWPEPNPEGRYLVAWGQRRYEAALELGWEEIRAEITDATTPEEVALIREKQVVENLMRQNLKDVELANAWKELQAIHGWNDSELARRFSVTPGMVSRLFALLELPGEVQDQIRAGEISATAGAAIAQLADPALQVEVANRAVAEGLDVAKTKAAVAEASARDTGKRERAAGKSGASRGVRKPAAPKVKPTWSHKAESKYKITVEHKKGIEPGPLVAALEHALVAARSALPAGA